MQMVLTPQSRGRIVAKAVAALEGGEIVVYPADTVYGIAVDATNAQAVAVLDRLKKRRKDQKYSYNFSGIEMVKKYANLAGEQEKILAKYLPGPFTFIINDDFSVRIPKGSIITEITSAFGKPTTATSANITGENPASSIRSLSPKIYLAADLIIEDVAFQSQLPSTLVDISRKPYRVLRKGRLPFKE